MIQRCLCEDLREQRLLAAAIGAKIMFIFQRQENDHQKPSTGRQTVSFCVAKILRDRDW